jgi:hypothetical protein
MPRPAVLVVEPQATRRKELSRGLTSLGSCSRSASSLPS